MPSFTNSQGLPIHLGQKIGVGGEGAVYDVTGQPDIVAKIYHQALTEDRANKIRAMLSVPNQLLRQMTAWPSDLVIANERRAVGLLMVTGHTDVHNLSRKANFPSATFPFLVHAAGNIARAFATVHAAGCVIGDVNHRSVRVSGRATVKLIDCDSFQVRVGRQLYLCEVAVPTFTPPELQSRSLRGVVRTTNHDNFGLAVLIFHLLFMGRHPFASRFLGHGDITIEAAIQQFRFAYGQHRNRTQMEPPPHVPPLAAASSELARLFETAFSREGCKEDERPAAFQWLEALDGLSKTLVPCQADRAHAYVRTLGSCPWCDVEVARLLVTYPFYVRGSILAGIYGTLADTPTFGSRATLVTSVSVDAGVVAAIAKAILAHLAELGAAHPALVGLKAEEMTQGLTLPLHPAAAMVYKELGLLKQ